MVFVRFPAGKVIWSVAPDIFASSNVVERGFCRSCGTPLTYRWLDGPNVSLPLNSLDAPTAVPPPTVSLATEQRASWLSKLDGLDHDECGLDGTPGFTNNQRCP